MIMQDSYKELIEEIASIKLIDVEVNWTDKYKQINEFCYIKPLAKHYRFTFDNKTFEERIRKCSNGYHDFYLECCRKKHISWMREIRYLENSKILIKAIANNPTTLRNLPQRVMDSHMELTGKNFEYLKLRREKLKKTCEGLRGYSFDYWGRDHEYLGGTYTTHTEKEIIPAHGYRYKFNINRLFGILERSCIVNNKGGDYNHNNYDAKYFCTNEGRIVYVTCDFLTELESLFNRRCSVLDEIISQYESINNIGIGNNELEPAVASGGDGKGKGKKEFKLTENATAKERRINNAFKDEMDKPRMTITQALSNLQKRTDLGVGKKVKEPNLKSNRKYIHDKLKEFGLALKEK